MARCGKCGSTDVIEDGGRLRCRACGASVKAAAAPPPAAPVFEHDRFLLRQRFLTMHDRYDVCDEQGEPIAYVVRPYHLRSLLALLAAFLTIGAIFALAFLILGSMKEPAQEAVLIPAAVLGLAAFVFVAYGLTPKRHVTLSSDAEGRDVLLRVRQDGRFQFPLASYTVQTPDGETIARLRYNRLFNVQRRWRCDPAGVSWSCIAREESLALSLLKPLLRIRQRVVLLDEQANARLGVFDRRSTILGRHVLDLTADRRRQLDRRVALALGVMLDTTGGR